MICGMGHEIRGRGAGCGICELWALVERERIAAPPPVREDPDVVAQRRRVLVRDVYFR